MIVWVRPGPDGVTLLATCAFLASIGLLFTGTAFLLQVGTSSDGPQFIGILIVYGFGYAPLLLTTSLSGAAILVLSVLYLAAGIGLLLKTLWGWMIGIGLSLAGTIFNLIQAIVWPWTLVFPIDWLGLILYPSILYYLVTPTVRKFFTKNSSVANPSTQA